MLFERHAEAGDLMARAERGERRFFIMAARLRKRAARCETAAFRHRFWQWHRAWNGGELPLTCPKRRNRPHQADSVRVLRIAGDLLRLALFDFDGTLADSYPVFADSLNGLAARHGFRQTEMEPGYVYLHPDGNSLVFGRSAEQTAAEIRRFSTADATEFLALMQLVNTFIDLAIPMMRVDPAQMNLGAKWQALKVLMRKS